MPQLLITLDVTADPVLEDPHEVADDLLLDGIGMSTRYSDAKMISAEWAR